MRADEDIGETVRHATLFDDGGVGEVEQGWVEGHPVGHLHPRNLGLIGPAHIEIKEMNLMMAEVALIDGGVVDEERTAFTWRQESLKQHPVGEAVIRTVPQGVVVDVRHWQTMHMQKRKHIGIARAIDKSGHGRARFPQGFEMGQVIFQHHIRLTPMFFLQLQGQPQDQAIVHQRHCGLPDPFAGQPHEFAQFGHIPLPVNDGTGDLAFAFIAIQLFIIINVRLRANERRLFTAMRIRDTANIDDIVERAAVPVGINLRTIRAQDVELGWMRRQWKRTANRFIGGLRAGPAITGLINLGAQNFIGRAEARQGRGDGRQKRGQFNSVFGRIGAEGFHLMGEFVKFQSHRTIVAQAFFRRKRNLSSAAFAYFAILTFDLPLLEDCARFSNIIPTWVGGSTMPESILVLDDDEHTLWLISTLLQHHGFQVLKTASPLEGLKLARDQKPDLILLDVMMPEMDGWEVCRRLRETSQVPIIFITAKNAMKDVVKGLEIGGDDYIVKPFDNRELVARIKAHMRRGDHRAADELTFANGDLNINFLSREVKVRGDLVELTPKEFALLSLLARNAGRVLTRSELIAQAWGPEYGDANESLKLYIHYLRKKIERHPDRPDFILTSRGVGYRFANR